MVDGMNDLNRLKELLSLKSKQVRRRCLESLRGSMLDDCIKAADLMERIVSKIDEKDASFVRDMFAVVDSLNRLSRESNDRYWGTVGWVLRGRFEGVIGDCLDVAFREVEKRELRDAFEDVMEKCLGCE